MYGVVPLVHCHRTSSESKSEEFFDLPRSFLEVRKSLKMTSKWLFFSKLTVDFERSMLLSCDIRLANTIGPRLFIHGFLLSCSWRPSVRQKIMIIKAAKQLLRITIFLKMSSYWLQKLQTFGNSWSMIVRLLLKEEHALQDSEYWFPTAPALYLSRYKFF